MKFLFEGGALVGFLLYACRHKTLSDNMEIVQNP